MGFDSEQAVLVCWNLWHGESWRSERRRRRNPEPLTACRALLGRETWRGLVTRVVSGAREGKLSRRLLALAFDAFACSPDMRVALFDAQRAFEMERARGNETGTGTTTLSPLSSLQKAVDAAAGETFGETDSGSDAESDSALDAIRRRVVIGWGPTSIKVASRNGAPTECGAIGVGCALLGLRADARFLEPPEPWRPRTRRRVPNPEGSGSRRFLGPGGRIDLAAIPPMPKK